MKLRCVMPAVSNVLLISLLPFSAARAQVGGGIVDAGLLGSYYSTPDLSGSAAFTRRDVRIRFDWPAGHRPGGNPMDAGFRDVPATGFSVRWEGRLIARFSETYTFHLSATDGARLYVREAGGSWTLLADSWSTGGTVQASLAMMEGVAREVRVEAKKTSAAGGVTLRWESPGTPLEVVECASVAAINHTAFEQTFTDAVRSARYSWENVDGQTVTTDADGWPVTSKAGLIVSEYLAPYDPSPLETGRNAFRFTGRADVTAIGNYQIVPGSVSYDSGTNTTSGLLTVAKAGSNVQMLEFRNATRNGQPGGPPGFTDLRIMRPTSPGSTVTFPFDSLFHPALLDSYSLFTALRYQRINDQTRTWAERMRPAHFRSLGKVLPYVYQSRYGGGGLFGGTGMPHEMEIMLCNAIGKDYYVTVPHLATVGDAGSYIRKLALLIKHGSDGNEPYPSPVANPVYPPLNPNLNVIVEVGNELWNFAQLATYSPFFDFQQLMKDKADANDADFQILNFDGLSLAQDGGGYVNAYTWARRWWALYLKKISDDFRIVFGDAAMPGEGITQPRVRPFFTWQYANTNETAVIGLDFMDRYFNNADGVVRTATPRPPAYYFFSGGGAGYYSVENREGIVPGVPVRGFESPSITGSQTRPTGVSGVIFEGDSGLVRPGTGDAGSGSILNPPPVMEGSQCAWLRTVNGASARVRVSFTIPAQQSSDRYALVYRWVQRTKPGASSADQTRLRVLVNGLDVTVPSDIEQPKEWSAVNQWRRVAYWVGNYYWSQTFTAAAGSTIEVVVETTNTSGDHVTFLDDMQLTSIDAFYSGGLGSGAATGQGAASYTSYQYGDGRWAAAYGLRQDTYEHGYSAGGDSGNSPLQDYAKFIASQAAASAVEALDIFHSSGGRMPTFGTYSTIPLGEYINGQLTEGVLNPSAWPLMQGISAVLARLPLEPDNGVPVPASLVPSAQNITLGRSNSGARLPAAGSWISYNLLVPHSGSYTIGISRTGSGTLRAFVDGFEAGSTTGTSLQLPARFLTKGLHSLRLLNSGGDITISQVNIEQPGAPGRPEILTASTSGTNVLLSWSQPAGATNYRLRWGSTPDAMDFETTTTQSGITLSGFSPGGIYYFVASSLQGKVESLPSTPRGLVVLPNNTSGKLAIWDMAEANGTAVSVAPMASTPRLQTTALVRGSGYANNGNSIFAAGRFTFTPVGNAYASSAAAAASANQFVQFQIVVPGGLGASVSKVVFRPYLQGSASAWRAAISYSTDGANFAWAGPEFQPVSGAVSEVDLAAVGALQNVTATTITFRIHLYGGTAYSTAGIGGNEGSPDLFVEGMLNPPGGASSFIGSLASWEFQGSLGNESSASPIAAVSGISASTITRGAGFLPPDSLVLVGGRFGLYPQGDQFRATPEQAITAGQFAQITLAPQSGKKLSISSVRFRPYFQNHSDSASDPRKCRIYYRFAGGPATPLPAPSEFGSNQLHQVPTSSVTALQNLTDSVTLLFVFYGSTPYETVALGQSGTPDIEISGSLQTPPATTLARFRSELGLDESGADDLLIPAGDGVPNLLKFAFNMIGTGPGQTSALNVPNTSILAAGGQSGLPFSGVNSSGRLTLTYLRQKDASNPGISYAAEFSETLAPGSWLVADSSSESAVSLDESWERVTVTAPSTTGKMFGRIRVTVSNPAQ